MVNRFNDPHIFEKSRWCPSRPALLAFFSDLKRPVPTTHRWHVFISHDLATIECLSCLLNAVLCTTKAVETQLVFSHCGMASNRWFYHCWMGLAVRLFGAHKWWSCEEMLLLLRAGQWPSGPVAQWPSGPVASDDGYTLAATLVTPLEYARGHHGPLVPHHFVGWVHLAGTCEEGPKVCIGLQSLHYFLLPCTFGAFEHPKSFLIGGYSRY